MNTWKNHSNDFNDSDLPKGIVLVRVIFDEEYFKGSAYEVTEEEWARLTAGVSPRENDGAFEGQSVNSRLLDLITDREDVGPLYDPHSFINIERCITFIDLHRNYH